MESRTDTQNTQEKKKILIVETWGLFVPAKTRRRFCRAAVIALAVFGLFLRHLCFHPNANTRSSGFVTAHNTQSELFEKKKPAVPELPRGGAKNIYQYDMQSAVNAQDLQ